MRARLLFVAVLLTSAGALPAVSAAQQSLHSASITGTVRDPSAGAVPRAPVTLRSVSTSAVQTARTDDAGRFTFVGVPPGRYELRVTAPGFAPAAIELTVTVGQAIDLPVALPVGDVAARVDVRAETPLLDARRTQAAHTIRQDEIDGLPLNGRNYLDLALLAPGVSRTVQRSTERFAETSAVPGTGISVSSQRNLANTFVVDGLSSDDDAAGLAGTFYTQDVIREFQVITSGAPALFGRAAAGVISIVTQSGGNMRSGRAYGYFRNDNLDARNALATREDPLAQQQFGATLSGPVVRNRMFFFANAESTHLARTGVVTIAPSAIDTIAATLGRTGYPSAAPQTGAFDTGYDTANLFARLDATTASGARVTGRYTFYDVASQNARNVGGLNAVTRGTRLDNRDQTGAMTWATFGSRRFNELRGQATRSRLGAPANDLIGPAANIAGVASFGTSTTSPTARALDMFEVGDSLTLDRGAHIVTTGGNLVYERLSIDFPGALQGLYTFQSLAAFTEGRYVNYQQAFGRPTQYQTNTNLSAFVQDEWRVRSAVTVSAGLRYDVQRLADPIQTDTNNLAPRLGVAIASSDGRTVVRASAGLHFDRIPLRAVSNALQRNGLDYQVAQLSLGQAGAPAFPQVLAAFPAGILSNVTTIDPGIQNGLGRQFDVQLERQIARRLTAEVTYVYLNSRRIIMSRNVNVPTLSAAEAAARGVPNLGRPDPAVANNSQFQSIGSADQDGLMLSLRQDGTRWGSHRASYTLSKADDDAGNAFFSSPQDNFDVAADYGRSDNDQRHRLVLSGVTPAFEGFSVSYVFAAASAPPFNIVTGADRNGDTTVNDRPAGVARNTGTGFGSSTLDLRVSHRVRLGSHSLELSVDGFNVLNRANYLIPNNVFGPGAVPPAAFGRPTAAGPATGATGRTMEFLMKHRTAFAAIAVTLLAAWGAHGLRGQTQPASAGTQWLEVPGRTGANPSIAARGAFVAVVWGATHPDTGTDVFVATSHDAGATFGAPVRVNAAAGEARISAERPPVVVLPQAAPIATGIHTAAAQEVAVAWSAGGAANSVRVARSRDGGRTFAAPLTLQKPGAAGNRGWVWMAADPAGNLHTIWLDHRDSAAARATGGSGGHVHEVASASGAAGSGSAAPGGAGDRSTHDGVAMAQRSGLYYARTESMRSPSAEHVLTMGVCYCCKTAIAAGPGGRIVAAWRHVYPGNLRDIAVATSTDDGRTFSTPVRASEDGWSIDGCPENGPSVAVDGTGTTHLVWPTVLSGREPSGALFYAAGSGATLSPRLRIPTLASRDPEHVQLATADGRSLAVVWDEVVSGRRGVVLRRLARAQGQTTVGPATLVSEGREARHPALAITDRGLLVAWTDGSPAEGTKIAIRRVPWP